MYEEDLAHVHDAGFLFLAEAAAGELLPRLAALGRPATVVELGCGSGALLAELVAAGHAAHGIDVSPAMLALARERAPGATLELGSALDVAIPECDALCAVGEVLSYDPDGRNTPDALARLLARAARALRPGGVLLADLAIPGRVPGGRASSHRLGTDWAVLVEAEEAEGRVRRRIVTFRDAGHGYRRAEETHELVLHSAGDAAAVLRRAGLRVLVRRGYRSAPRLPGHRVLIGRAAP